ncbi:MAG: hypothetical protein AAGA23_22870 [Pseudomonadota bacterium]
MPWSESDVQRVFKASLAPGDEHECASASEIWDAVHLVLPPEERRRIIDQVSRCPACAFIWQAAREMGEAPVDTSVPSSPPPESWWQKLLRPAMLGPALAGAAAVLVALVMLEPPATLDPLPPPSPSGVVRGEPQTNVGFTALPDTLQPGQLVAWSPVADAEGYRLTAVGADGVQWERVTLEPQWLTDESLSQVFEPDQQVILRVVVVGGDADGASSPEVSVRLGTR